MEILLTDWFPRKVIADHAFLAAMPEVLRAFIRYSDHEVGMPSARTASTLAAVDEWEPQYQQMIRSDRLQGAHALAARLIPGVFPPAGIADARSRRGGLDHPPCQS